MATIPAEKPDTDATETDTPAPSRWFREGPLSKTLSLPAALAVAALAGLIAVAAFPPYDQWYLAPVSVALLALAVHRRRLRGGFGVGTVYGAAFFLPLLAWSSTQVGQWPWVFLTLLQAVFIGLLGAALAAGSRLFDRHRALWPLAIALAWVGQEALRDRQPFGGFPWGRLAFSQADSPLVSFAWLGGAPLVTFAAGLAGGLLALAAWRLAAREARPAALLAVGAAAVFAAGYAVPTGTTAPSGEETTVAVVQGNVPRMGLDFNAQRRAVLDNHVQGTLDLADQVAAGDAPQPDFVVWAENSSDIDPFANPDAAEQIQLAAEAVGVPIYFGAIVTQEDGTLSNTSVVWDPEAGAVDFYTKHHPVPFAEYVPYKPFFRTVAGWIDPRMAEGIDNVNGFEAGTGPAVVDIEGTTVAGNICFEVSYDELVRNSVTDGAELLAVQTNNATFDNAEATQQLAQIRLRAVEHSRDSLMASTVGVSAFVDSEGRVYDATEFNTADVIVRTLTKSTETTPATRTGALPEILLVLVGTALLGWAAVHNVRARRAAADGR
ncbi:apolipoprotein N-acyltransferase [Salininema proteolyticum]|uniref:Apolipoprotein N-acyltransferase n=1 Tax=Salininema proteolyticum TaxID=1607685 RepID=A0ABV8U335_9ACTN